MTSVSIVHRVKRLVVVAYLQWVFSLMHTVGQTYNIWTSADHRYDVVSMYVSYHTSLEFRVQV